MSHLQARAEDLGYGHWTNILERAGVDSSFLSGKPCPCPFCGGKDRFQWKANKFGGVYICRFCDECKTGGAPAYRSGMHLLVRLYKGNFIEAANFVREYFGLDNGVKAGRVQLAPRRERGPEGPSSEEIAAGRERMNKLWNGAHAVSPGDPVHRYLLGRIPGLGVIPEQIRFHPRLAYYDPPAPNSDRFQLVGYFPAMLVRGFNAEGELVQLHKTYLTADGAKAAVTHSKKTDRGIGSNSFALRLIEPDGDTLGVSEGIETALSAFVLDGVPTWPCHSAGILANFVLPVHLRGRIKRLRIYADSDEVKNGRRAGSHAAAQLSDRSRKDGLRTMIIRPARVGQDMNDVLLNLQ